MSDRSLEPSQLAAALAKELEAGFAASLLSAEASAALVVDRIIARVSSVPQPHSGSIEWGKILWQGEAVLYPGEGGTDEAHPAEDDHGDDRPVAASLAGEIALLSVEAIQGVGSVWVQRLQRWGISTVGELAEADLIALAEVADKHWSRLVGLIGRAKNAVIAFGWEIHPSDAGTDILTIARSGVLKPSGSVYDSALRNYALTLVSVLDLEYAAKITVR